MDSLETKPPRGRVSESAEKTSQMSLPLDPAAAPPVVADWRAQVPSVSQLTRRIRGHIENSFFDVWVRGEISNFRKPISGHSYFQLKDATAQLRAVMFKGQLAKLKFDLKDGMEILIHGTITVYEAKGDYQLVADSVEPVGAGALQAAFEQLKARLQAEGLFDPKYKKRLPFLPSRIGIITSATGAAVKDILKVLHRRFPNREVLILPASVQGDKAAGEICRAIEQAEEWNRSNPTRALDVLIIGRGGGSLEDLWCFNEEVVARAIFKCGIPIISAVGHEIDFTIADFVADIRAPTPSAAAEMVIPAIHELQNRVDNHSARMNLFINRRLQQIRLHLGHLGQRLVDPRQRIKNLRESFRLLEEKLVTATRTRLLLSKNRLKAAAAMLQSLSPLQTIARGFTMTKDDAGNLLRSVKHTKPGQKIVTQLADGAITSEVLSLDPKAR